jgi:hypothetical protein
MRSNNTKGIQDLIGWPRGWRIVEMSENPFSVESWIRMENDSHIVLG